jgi:hypothetical protein
MMPFVMSSNKSLVNISALLVFLSLAAMLAQTGGISGTVKDPSGAAIPKATVSLMNQDTNARQADHRGAGAYAFPQV